MLRFWHAGLGLGNQSWCLSALPSGCDLCLDLPLNNSRIGGGYGVVDMVAKHNKTSMADLRKTMLRQY